MGIVIEKINPGVRMTENNILVTDRRAKLTIANWNALANDQISKGEGFRITEPGKSDVDEDPGFYSIHSPLYGSECNNENGFLGIFTCKCGALQGQFYADGHTICKKCKEKVSFHEIDMRKTGWIVIDRDYILNPTMFQKISGFMGKDHLAKIMEYEIPRKREVVKGNPYVGIGMVEFKERFYEIMDYFLGKGNGPKLAKYNVIMENRDAIFTHAIPVYNMHLRHFMISDSDVKYSKADIIFKRIYTNVQLLNDRYELQRRRTLRAERENRRLAMGDDTRSGSVERLRRENILYSVQQDVLKLWALSFSEIDTSKKSGLLRQISAGGRINYIGRSVIVKNVYLEPDKLGLSYTAFLEMYKNEIIEKLCEQYQMTHKQASSKWEAASVEFDQTVYEIMQYMYKKETQYCDTWRNPTINYGSTMTMKVGNVNSDIDDYCMELPVLILTKPNADMDGDIMNHQAHPWVEGGRIMYERQNPLDHMFISHNDGLFDNDFNLKKDMEILAHSFYNI